MKIIFLTLLTIISFLFTGCLVGTQNEVQFSSYVPPKNTGTKIVYQDKVVYKDKIVYKEGSVSSTEQTRTDFKNSAEHFSFKSNGKQDYNAYALIIGINKYKENTDVANADYSALSFEKLAKTTLGIPAENIITLINSEASSGQLKSKLAFIKEIPEKGGSIYLFYAGHGVPGKDGKVYMLPSDMSADSIHLEPNLQLDKIYKNLSQSLASNIFVFMDSCFSGKDDKGALLYRGVAPVMRVNKTKIESRKLTIMTAGANTDFANDYTEKNQRLFSYHLINELSQGTKDLKKAYDSVRRKVKRTSLQKGIGYKQVPQIYGASARSLY